ncbi:hypothetical protein [Ferrimonas marina]|uniref:hypothetical protein n=1 Tax=Ferrimonas marina TaxID=299255 RepID=UPI0014706034|nr:hypothetical protein [Ferrimonas marina]
MAQVFDLLPDGARQLATAQGVKLGVQSDGHRLHLHQPLIRDSSSAPPADCSVSPQEHQPLKAFSTDQPGQLRVFTVKYQQDPVTTLQMGCFSQALLERLDRNLAEIRDLRHQNHPVASVVTELLKPIAHGLLLDKALGGQAKVRLANLDGTRDSRDNHQHETLKRFKP